MTISTTPTTVAAGETCTLVSTLAGATDLVWQVTSVPPRSTVPLGFLHTAVPAGTTLDSPAAVIRAGAQTSQFTPDLAGEYGFTVMGYLRVVNMGGRITLVGVESGTVGIASAMTLPIGTTTGHSVTLRLLVVGTTVKSASLVNPTTGVAESAAKDATVLSKVAALVGVTVSNLDDDLLTATTELRNKYNGGHRQNTGGAYHRPAPDSTNTVSRFAPSSKREAIALLSELQADLRGHFVAIPPPASRWHQDVDYTSQSVDLVASASDDATATVLNAWLRRCYRSHIATTTVGGAEVHQVTDTTNTLSAVKPLADCIATVLDTIASQSPSAVAGFNLGTLQAGHLFGFKAE